MTTFSVVVPLYNKRPHIERAINSALTQTVPAHEIIVIDDGSTDGSYEYVQGIGDHRIKLHRRDRPGPGGYAARNLGIELATADWIAFLDADDEWLPHHLETVDKTMQICDRPKELVCVGTGFRNVYPGGREEQGIYTKYRKGARPELMNFRDMLSTWLAVGGAPIWTSATACRRDALLAAGLFPADRCSRGGDKDMWLRIAALGVTAINPTVSATYYKDSVNMVTGKVSANDRHCMCQTIEAMLQSASAEFKPLLRKVSNLEVFKYCLRTVKTTRLNQITWKGFYASENPAQYLILATLSNGLTAMILRSALRSRPSSLQRALRPSARFASHSLPRDFAMTDAASTGTPEESRSEGPRSLDDLAKPHNAGCARSAAELVRLLKADLFRYSGKANLRSFFRHFLFTPGYKYTVWMRTCGYLRVRRWTKWTLYLPVKYILVRCRYKYGIVIPEYTVIGPGFFINRFGGIYVNGDAVIGSNVNFTHGIMLGQQNRGPLMGSPIVGDRVFLAAGAKVIGRVKLGNGSVIGANAVVTRDVPENAVVGGIPAKVLSLKGSDGYINRQVSA